MAYLRFLTANPLGLPFSVSKLTQAGYKFSNPFLRQYNSTYGMMDLIAKLKACWKAGLGYIGNNRIDMDFFKSLNKADRQIIQSAHHVIYNEDLIITQL